MSGEAKTKQLFAEIEGERLLLDHDNDTYLSTADVRSAFADLSKGAPSDLDFERAFVASKLRLARGHKQLAAAELQAAEGQMKGLFADLAIAEEPPPPGGVGYGMFFTPGFRSAFATGTVVALDFIAPTKPGGNVSTWLYLTTTNRTAKGVEAFVLYNGQDDLRFRVFDWARDDHWQTNIGFADLGDYITHKTAHGTSYQVLSLQNQTFIVSGTTWTNNVWLQNYARGGYDLVYSYEYTSSEAEQKAGWVGSWGPIVETFQNSYSDTNQLGFLRTYFQARDAAMSWSPWVLLSQQQSDIRNDNLGFKLIFLDPNHSFAVS